MTLRLAFLGTAEFAVPSLRAVVQHHQVVTVITQPDKPGHRGRPASRPVADLAVELGIPVQQPRRIRDADATAAVLALGIDALVVAAYGQILPVELLQGPRLGGINVHGSLLPRWRGAAPVARAILAGDETSGVCIMQMEAGLDTGPVYARTERPIGSRDTTPTLMQALAEDGAGLLTKVLGDMEVGTVSATPQDEEGVTYATRLSRADGVVDWASHSAADVDRMVRALRPWPGVTATVADVAVSLVRGYPARGDTGSPGSIAASLDSGVCIQTADGVYVIEQLQPPGKRVMGARDFLRGRRWR